MACILPHVWRDCPVQYCMNRRCKDGRYPPHLGHIRCQHPTPKLRGAGEGVLTQCDVWNSPMPTASPKHRPGNMAAPVYPGCMVAVIEVLHNRNPEWVSQRGRRGSMTNLPHRKARVWVCGLTLHRRRIRQALDHILHRTAWLDGDLFQPRMPRTWDEPTVKGHVRQIYKKTTDRRTNVQVNSVEAACQTVTSPSGSIQQPALWILYASFVPSATRRRLPPIDPPTSWQKT